MATILITGDNAAALARIRGVIEGLGHSLIHAVTTENVIEDVTLNECAMVITAQSTRPFSEWETCEMLHGDPSMPIGLSVLLLHSGDYDRRKFSQSTFDGEINSSDPADILSEEIIRCLGTHAAPETMDPLANSGFD